MDRLIQELQRQQDNRILQEGGEPLASPPPVGAQPRVSRSNSGMLSGEEPLASLPPLGAQLRVSRSNSGTNPYKIQTLPMVMLE